MNFFKTSSPSSSSFIIKVWLSCIPSQEETWDKTRVVVPSCEASRSENKNVLGLSKEGDEHLAPKVQVPTLQVLFT